jgi:hypothetical protein
MNAWPLFFFVIGLTIGFAILIGNADIEQEKANFKDIRCNLGVMLRAFLLKPKGDPRSSISFASDNFQFCIRENARNVLMRMLSPLLMVFTSQLNVASGLGTSLNMMRTMKAELLKGFQKIMDPFFRRFVMTVHQGGRIYQQMNSAISRVFGVALSTLFLGIGVYRSIDNSISFIIKVVLIILLILSALFILMFFALSPFLGILIATSFAVASIVGASGAVSFCFPPDSIVLCKDGKGKPISEMEIGDILLDGGRIEGILKVDGRSTPLYNLNGVYVSGNHLVWNEMEQRWCSVQEHVDAVLDPAKKSDILYCLRTSHRTIFLSDPNYSRKILFRDWEEIPWNLAGADDFWDSLIYGMLNDCPRRNQRNVPEEDPLFGNQVKVMQKDGGKILIEDVCIGDILLQSKNDKKGTKILGIYQGKKGVCSAKGYSDGVWWKEASGSWEHRKGKGSLEGTVPGFHLVTDSGIFWVETESGEDVVRDFTEVGWRTLGETESFVKHLLSLEKNHAHGIFNHRSSNPLGGQHSSFVF